MMAVTVAVGPGEARHQHVRPELADDADDVRKRNVVTAPLLKSFFGRLRVSEISNPGEPLLDSVVTISRQQLKRAQNAELIGKGIAGFILSALASCKREQKCLHSLAPCFKRQQAAILIVRMGDYHHQATGGLQFAQLLLQACGARVLRKRIKIARSLRGRRGSARWR